MQQVKFFQTNGRGSQCRFKKVMLIDDNEIENFVNKKLIETTEFSAETECCLSAETALEKIRNSIIDELPEIIFLDIKMPGMDGFGFLDEFAMLPTEVHQHVKIIMLSTSESFKDLNRANKNKFVYRFLNKPLFEQALEAIVF
jgi:CheY-like chemotaxis protein